MYVWNSRKLTRKIHIIGENGLTLCKAENGRVFLDSESENFPKHRKLCGICGFLRDGPNKRPKKARGTKRTPKKVDSFLYSREWKEVRYRALRMSKGRCECCGRGSDDGVVLHVDHIKPRHKFPELALSLSNLQVLCAACNLGKGGWDDTDWREPRLATLMGEAV